jgi:outer membrane biosynthesis protein TonB
MLKYILLIINFLILFIAPSFQSGDAVNVACTFPGSAKPGSTFTVEVTVKKGSVGGFAKLQQELPAGLTASAGEGKGSTFTFVDQKVKFVWVSLPADAEFQISYKVTVAPDAAGAKSFGGTFSYLENNESRKFNINPGTINISSDGNAPIAAVTPAPTPEPAPVATSTPPAPEKDPVAPPVKENEVAKEPAPGVPSPESTTAEHQTTPQETPSSNNPPAPIAATGAVVNGLEIVRTMPSSISPQEKEFVVELLVKKQNIGGFAKIQEELPEGFTATAIDTKGATFSFASQKVKFVWMSLPPSGEFKISYKVSVDPSVNGTKSIEGLFSFLDNSESKKYTITANSITIGGASSGQPLAAKEPAVQKAEEPKVAKEPEAKATKNQPKAANNNEVSKLSKIPAPVSGIEFKIQVSAAKKEIPNPNDFFKTTFSLTENVNAEMHEGWHKYTSGSFPYYVKAHDFRNEAWAKGIKGSFVVAYNSGTRITVQEALLITKQRWVQ